MTIVKVNPKDYLISPLHLDNLAMEFVGRNLTNSDDLNGECEYGFDSDEKEGWDGTKNAVSFRRALVSYQKGRLAHE